MQSQFEWQGAVSRNITSLFAEIAQLVEHNLAKVGVAGPSPVFRSCRDGGIGRHEGLKIPWPVMAVRVRVPLAALPLIFSYISL